MPTIAGSWVDETFANGHHAAEDRAAADTLQSAPATWQPSSVHVPPRVSTVIVDGHRERSASASSRLPDAQHLLRYLMVTLPFGCLLGEAGGGGAMVGAGGDPWRPQL
jgi:hypothetical protein